MKVWALIQKTYILRRKKASKIKQKTRYCNIKTTCRRIIIVYWNEVSKIKENEHTHTKANQKNRIRRERTIAYNAKQLNSSTSSVVQISRKIVRHKSFFVHFFSHQFFLHFFQSFNRLSLSISRKKKYVKLSWFISWAIYRITFSIHLLDSIFLFLFFFCIIMRMAYIDIFLHWYKIDYILFLLQVSMFIWLKFFGHGPMDNNVKTSSK